MKKRVLSVLVAMVMMAAMLTACGEKTDDALIGTWTCEMDYASHINEGLASEPELVEYMKVDEFVLEITLTLKEDGTYTMSADSQANKDSFEELKGKLKDGMIHYLTDAAEAADMTLDDLLDASDITIDELVEEAFGDDMYDSIIGDMTAEGKYEAKDGKLFTSQDLDSDLDSNYETYELSGNTLTITGDANGTTDGIYPLVFKK